MISAYSAVSFDVKTTYEINTRHITTAVMSLGDYSPDCCNDYHCLQIRTIIQWKNAHFVSGVTKHRTARTAYTARTALLADANGG